jgi:Ca2+-binding EF-hand superfamily protein
MTARLGAAALVVLMALQGAAHAQDAAQLAMMEKRFAAADKDHDGKLTLEEAQAGMPRVAKNFARIDAGKKGFVTLEDIKAAMAEMSGR